MNATAAKTTVSSKTNPVLLKLRTIPKDSRKAWVRGFLKSFNRVYFAHWSVEDADAARPVLVRWTNVYSGANR